MNLYQKKDGRHYGGFFNKDFLVNNKISHTYTLIWSRKSDNDIKIEEIEKTINNMDQEHIKRSEELRRQIEGLKA
jgi:hypothetical protein